MKDNLYICSNCKKEIHRDINASFNISQRGLKSFGLIAYGDYKAFRVVEITYLGKEDTASLSGSDSL